MDCPGSGPKVSAASDGLRPLSLAGVDPRTDRTRAGPVLGPGAFRRSRWCRGRQREFIAVMAIRERSTFARRFSRVYHDVALPEVYRRFIMSDSYQPYRRSFIRGLSFYDPTEDVEL